MSDTLRMGQGIVVVHPFTPEEEWLSLDEFAERDLAAGSLLSSAPVRSLRITKIDLETKTVTLE